MYLLTYTYACMYPKIPNAHGPTDLDPTFHWLTKNHLTVLIATVNLATVISLQCLKWSYLRLC